MTKFTYLELYKDGRREKEYRDGVIYFIEKKLCDKNSKWQRITVGVNSYYGRMLFLDGVIQFAERDEYIYHELLVHPAMLLHPHPKNILILGGGDGFVLREVIKHESVEKVTLVEIDEKMIKTAKTYWPDLLEGAFDDGRVKVVIGDAMEFIKNPPEKYDVVILDLVDPQPNLKEDYFFNPNQIPKYTSLLMDGGILVTHGETADESNNFLGLRIYELFRRHFQHVKVYQQFIPSFRFEWTFVLASKDRDLEIKEQHVEKAKKLEKKLKWLNPYLLPSLNHLPLKLKDIKDELQRWELEEILKGNKDFDSFIYPRLDGEELKTLLGEKYGNRNS